MMDPFAEFEAIRKARTPLPLRLAEGVTVEFPGAPTVAWRLDFVGLLLANPDADPEDIMFALMGKLVDDGTIETISQHVSEPELKAILRGVLEHYDLKGIERPDPKKAPKTPSGDPSSDSSEPLMQTSESTGA